MFRAVQCSCTSTVPCLCPGGAMVAAQQGACARAMVPALPEDTRGGGSKHLIISQYSTQTTLCSTRTSPGWMECPLRRWHWGQHVAVRGALSRLGLAEHRDPSHTSRGRTCAWVTH